MCGFYFILQGNIFGFFSQHFLRGGQFFFCDSWFGNARTTKANNGFGYSFFAEINFGL